MCSRAKNKLMVRIKLLDFSPEFDSVVDLSCFKDNPLKNGGFNVKIKMILYAFAIQWFLTEKSTLKIFPIVNIARC